ncbi:hypothetical protein B0T20DRAFT_246901 [Sordaria brevicollis]|uniref:Uncharacterized protein n=1 Tax=Sordaria brevicollis TaxID=83679 RepID=A0AAE0PBT7_SORBR|nr:hypothetical protein B0T20DRAFT_246901 [Sordaria brevicollis]
MGLDFMTIQRTEHCSLCKSRACLTVRCSHISRVQETPDHMGVSDYGMECTQLSTQLSTQLADSDCSREYLPLLHSNVEVRKVPTIPLLFDTHNVLAIYFEDGAIGTSGRCIPLDRLRVPHCMNGWWVAHLNTGLPTVTPGFKSSLLLFLRSPHSSALFASQPASRPALFSEPAHSTTSSPPLTNLLPPPTSSPFPIFVRSLLSSGPLLALSLRPFFEPLTNSSVSVRFPSRPHHHHHWLAQVFLLAALSHRRYVLWVNLLFPTLPTLFHFLSATFLGHP